MWAIWNKFVAGQTFEVTIDIHGLCDYAPRDSDVFIHEIVAKQVGKRPKAMTATIFPSCAAHAGFDCAIGAVQRGKGWLSRAFPRSNTTAMGRRRDQDRVKERGIARKVHWPPEARLQMRTGGIVGCTSGIYIDTEALLAKVEHPNRSTLMSPSVI